MTQAAQTIALRLPPRAELVGVARGFAASAARLAGIDDARVEDIKIAVSEACGTAVRADHGAGDSRPVIVEISMEQGSMAFEVTRPGDTSSSEAPPGLDEGSLGLMLVDALFPGATIEGAADGATSVRFSVSVESEPAER